MTLYELIKRVYWALDEWIASSLGLGDYYGADNEDAVDEDQDEVENEDDEDAAHEESEEDEDEEDNVVADEDDGYDDMYKYHDHQA
jgi:hypothetical protein